MESNRSRLLLVLTGIVAAGMLAAAVIVLVTHKHNTTSLASTVTSQPGLTVLPPQPSTTETTTVAAGSSSRLQGTANFSFIAPAGAGPVTQSSSDGLDTFTFHVGKATVALSGQPAFEGQSLQAYAADYPGSDGVKPQPMAGRPGYMVWHSDRYTETYTVIIVTEANNERYQIFLQGPLANKADLNDEAVKLARGYRIGS